MMPLIDTDTMKVLLTFSNIGVKKRRVSEWRFRFSAIYCVTGFAFSTSQRSTLAALTRVSIFQFGRKSIACLQFGQLHRVVNFLFAFHNVCVNARACVRVCLCVCECVTVTF